MKVTVQSKIAELEKRIEDLEKGTKIHSRITERFASGTIHDSQMWKHWKCMWAEFDEVMKAAFKS